MGDLTILRNSSLQILRASTRILRSNEGLYTTWEIDEMLANGYIPVASGAELDALRTTTSQTMGAGTQWAGTYTTGLDKKYVQVRNIDLSAFANWIGIGRSSAGLRFGGIYDGNLLKITNFYSSNQSTSNDRAALFSSLGEGTENILRNTLIIDGEINVSVNNTNNLYQGFICSINAGGLIENCYSSGTITASNAANNHYSGGICGYNGNSGEINNCRSIVTINGQKALGGIVGLNEGLAIVKHCTSICTVSGVVDLGGIVGRNRSVVEYCSAIVDITSSGGASTASGNAVTARNGGVVGHNDTGTIRFCFSSGSLLSTGIGNAGRETGGICGENNGTVQNSYSGCNVNGTSYSGGGIGWNFGTTTNCYSIGSVTGSSSLGGFAGANNGTITNCYYDSQTSGRSDTGRGNPRTTLQMKAGTASSFINPDGTIDETESAANAMYTSWDNDIWDFLTTNDYPELK